MIKQILCLALILTIVSCEGPTIICSKTPTIKAPKGIVPTPAGTIVWNYDCGQKTCIQTTTSGTDSLTSNAFDTQDACNAVCKDGLTCHNPEMNLHPVKACRLPAIKGPKTASSSCTGPRIGWSFDTTQNACASTTVQCTDDVSPNFFMKQDSCEAFCSEAEAMATNSATGTASTTVTTPSTGNTAVATVAPAPTAAATPASASAALAPIAAAPAPVAAATPATVSAALAPIAAAPAPVAAAAPAMASAALAPIAAAPAPVAAAAPAPVAAAPVAIALVHPSVATAQTPAASSPITTAPTALRGSSTSTVTVTTPAPAASPSTPKAVATAPKPTTTTIVAAPSGTQAGPHAGMQMADNGSASAGHNKKKVSNDASDGGDADSSKSKSSKSSKKQKGGKDD